MSYYAKKRLYFILIWLKKFNMIKNQILDYMLLFNLKVGIFCKNR